MVYLMLSLLLTITAFCSIFLASLYSLWKNPPRLHIDLSGVPKEFTIIYGNPVLKSVVNGVISDEDIVPLDIIEYCDVESDPLTRDIRKRYAKTLRRELGSWPLALQQLQKEDGLEIITPNDQRATTG